MVRLVEHDVPHTRGVLDELAAEGSAGKGDIFKKARDEHTTICTRWNLGQSCV